MLSDPVRDIPRGKPRGMSLRARWVGPLLFTGFIVRTSITRKVDRPQEHPSRVWLAASRHVRPVPGIEVRLDQELVIVVDELPLEVDAVRIMLGCHEHHADPDRYCIVYPLGSDLLASVHRWIPLG